MEKLTSLEQEKIRDFKCLCEQFVNREHDSTKSKVIDALFTNVERFYLEFKDEITSIPAREETYEFHLLQPVNGRYSLLDFLINRAITNVENIEICGENAYDNAREIYIQADRYKKYEGKYSKEYLEKQQLKTYLHETSHAIKGVDFSKSGKIHPGRKNVGNHILEQRIQLAKRMLGDKYSNIIPLSKARNAEEEFISAYLDCPFGDSLFSEGATEMYAVKFADMILDNNLVGLTDIGKNRYVQVPNQLNGYAPFERFFFHLANNVSKESMFYSLFFGTKDALKEFSNNNRELLNDIWRKYPTIEREINRINAKRISSGFQPMQTSTPYDKFYTLFHNAMFGYVYSHGEITPITENSQYALDELFLAANKKRLTVPYDPDELKTQFAMAFCLSGYTVNEKNECVATDDRNEYLAMFKRMKEESSCKQKDTTYRMTHVSSQSNTSQGMKDEEIKASRAKLGI